MKTLRRLITRSFLTIGVAVMALALVPSVASAAPIVFTVHENAVPGVNPPGSADFLADGITGKYEEAVALVSADPGCLTLTSPCAGTFTANLVVRFAAYTNGGPTVPSNVAPGGTPAAIAAEGLNDDQYQLYALVTVNGNFSSTTFGTTTLFDFDPTGSIANFYTDPLRNTDLLFATASSNPITNVEDQHILNASAIDALGSDGKVFVCNAVAGCPTGTSTIPFGGVMLGAYTLVYTNPSLVNPDGPAYWPTLGSLTFTATASGDVDPFLETHDAVGFPGHVLGDTSVAFNQTAAVPEPASLTLLGLGLIGARFGARRRRKS